MKRQVSAFGMARSDPPMTDRPKRPRDANQLAKLIVDLATGEVAKPDERPLPDARKKDEGSCPQPLLRSI